MLSCIKNTLLNIKETETGFGDKGRFSLLCKHGNEDSLGFITEDIVKGRI